MALTDTAVRNAKPGPKLKKMSDGGNLYLAVQTSGTKSWRMDYSYLGKRKTLTFGVYPIVTLSDARAKRDEAKRLLVSGTDPSVARRTDKIAALAANGNTYGVIADEYLAKLKRDKRAEATLAKNEWMMKVLAAELCARPITDISPKDVLDVLRKIELSGRVESALATRAAIGRVFRYAIASARAENDPTFALRGALQRHVPINHPALTKPEDVGGLMRAIYGYEGWPSLAGLLKMQAICFSRPSETRLLEWAEIDAATRIWTIPASKAKMRRPHDVPLSTQAIALLEEMRPLSGAGSFVFPSMMSGKSVLSENSMNSALRRMGFTHDQHTAHGFRTTASTTLNESGIFSADAIEMQLAHLDKGKVRRTYNRAQYWEERVHLMQWWADLLDTARMTIPTVL
ncbi:MAG: Integrase family protein [Devosia sp.]|uniref:tyrosine-type recombinase/integrase n=1 Tax=Devosia sp. TaxID=1871048 RepID=UPI00262B6DF8|nr:integrase arm-type DNA-binding domain-containing protein [Devosia sp.]MDB5528097.1 Integrase family protein [Devosia sp.]